MARPNASGTVWPERVLHRETSASTGPRIHHKIIKKKKNSVLKWHTETAACPCTHSLLNAVKDCVSDEPRTGPHMVGTEGERGETIRHEKTERQVKSNLLQIFVVRV